MITWTIKYKLKGQLFFRRIRKVKGEIHLSQYTRAQNGEPAPYPIPTVEFVQENEKLTRIPMEGTIFVYGKERHIAILEEMRKQKNGDSKL